MGDNCCSSVGRCSDRTKDDGDTVVDQRDDSSAKRRKTKADQQWRGQGSRGPKTCCTFNERGEDIPNDDGLDSTVRVYIVEHTLYRRYSAGMLQGVHNQNCTENNNEGTDSLQESIQRPCEGSGSVLLPVEQCDQQCDNPADGQGDFCRLVECNHQYNNQQNG